MLEIKNIDLRINHKSLFQGDFRAGIGQVTMICGPVGSGKTTFFRNVFEREVKMSINGKKIWPPEKWYQQVAYVNQDVHLYDEFTFKELTSCFKFSHQVDFSDVGLRYVANKRVGQCSEGEKQRISHLVGLWKNPAILILDEPTSILDRKNQDRVMNLIRTYTKQNQCITLLSSHHAYDQNYADCLYEIKEKKLFLLQGNIITDKLKKKSNHFQLKNLVKWEKKTILQPMSLILSVFF